MKYIMIETEKGQKLPFIFPECINHDLAATMAQVLINAQFKGCESKPASAGFVEFQSVKVHGESKSLGGMKSVASDAPRIAYGGAVEFVDNDMLASMLMKAKP